MKNTRQLKTTKFTDSGFGTIIELLNMEGVVQILSTLNDVGAIRWFKLKELVRIRNPKYRDAVSELVRCSLALAEDKGRKSKEPDIIITELGKELLSFYHRLEAIPELNTTEKTWVYRAAILYVLKEFGAAKVGDMRTHMRPYFSLNEIDALREEGIVECRLYNSELTQEINWRDLDQYFLNICELTEKGHKLIPILDEIKAFGDNILAHELWKKLEDK